MVQLDEQLSAEDIAKLALNCNLRRIQCMRPMPDSLWIMLDNLFFRTRGDVELRIYGHYSEECDLQFLRHVGHVKRFSADCLMTARNLEAVAGLKDLELLGIGVFELRDFELLRNIPEQLQTLRLGPTRSGFLSLAPLERFRNLRTLYIEGHNKSIEVLSCLPLLEDVTLRSVTTSDLRYLAPLEKLWSLDVKLGGIKSFAGIEGKSSIKYLELWQIRNLENIDVISTLTGLQNLFLQSLPNVVRAPSVSDLGSLRRVVLQNLKGLTDLSSLEMAPALEEFGLFEAKRQEPEIVLPVLQNPNVKFCDCWFGSDRKNARFSQLCGKYAKHVPDRSLWEGFDYQ